MENKTTKTKVLIIGSGPAGMTAALYSARADLAPVVIAGAEPGGQLMWTTSVDNYPGFPDGIQGPKLMQDMIKQAEKYGTKMVYDEAVTVNLAQRPFQITTKNGESFSAESVILATGASARWLEVPGEEKLKGKGVHSCATCDGFFYKDKTVAVVGAGDSAMEEANFLTKFATKVIMLIRKGEDEPLRASEIMLKRARANQKIEWMYNVEITELEGEEKLQNVKLKNNATNTVSDLKVDGVFVAIGHDPNTKFFQDFVTVDEKGYVEAKRPPQTNIEGVFVAGDVNDWKYRQAVTAAGAGCKAAMEARWYLTEKEDTQPTDI